MSAEKAQMPSVECSNGHEIGGPRLLRHQPMLYDLAAPHHDGETCVHRSLLNGLLGNEYTRGPDKAVFRGSISFRVERDTGISASLARTVGPQMPELGDAQVSDGDEVRACPKPARCPLGLPEKALYGFNEGVAAAIDLGPKLHFRRAALAIAADVESGFAPWGIDIDADVCPPRMDGFTRRSCQASAVPAEPTVASQGV
jgi:hypothetical protein